LGIRTGISGSVFYCACSLSQHTCTWLLTGIRNKDSLSDNAKERIISSTEYCCQLIWFNFIFDMLLHKEYELHSFPPHKTQIFLKKRYPAPPTRWYIITYVFVGYFSPMQHQPPSGPRPPLYQESIITLRHTILCRNPLEEWSARCRDLYLTAHNTHNRQTSMSPAVFEPTIPASKRSQIYFANYRMHVLTFIVLWCGKDSTKRHNEGNKFHSN